MAENSKGFLATKLEQDDFSTKSVPKGESKGWISMGLIWAGVGISLGMIVTGGTIGNGMSFQQAVWASLIGGGVLALVTALCGIIGSNTGLSTAMISKFTFGKSAIIVIALIQAFGSYGWFGVQLGLFGETLSTASDLAFGIAPPIALCIVVGGICMILTAAVGYKALDLLSKIAVPLLIVLLFASVWRVLQDLSFSDIWNLQGSGEPMTLGFGVSTAIASFIVGAVVAPDVSRYGRSAKHTAGAAISAFAIVVPIMFVVGILLAQVAQTWDIVGIMLQLGWGVLALLVLLLAQWTSNDNNLYCAALGFAVVFKKMKKYQLTIIAGVIGIILALMGIYDNLIVFLSFLGVLIPPMGGVMIADYYFFNRRFYRPEFQDRLRNINLLPFAAWIAGSGVAILTTYTAFDLTTAPSIDGLIIGFAVHFVGSKFIKRELIEDTEPAGAAA